MDLKLCGKRALVTGGGRGLGRSIAECLSSEGAMVGVVSRTESDIVDLVQAIGGENRGHWGLPLDLVIEGAPQNLISEMKQASFWPIDIAVHNLGGALDIRDPFCSLDEWRKTWRLNLEIAIELNLMLIPDMQSRNWGRIVHIGSVAGSENQGPVHYCAVKAAVTAYSRSMGRVLAADGIAVSAVLPGAVFTERGYWDQASRERPQHVARYLADRMAIGRFGRPEEIADLVTFLCSESASFLTGSVIPVDGGQGQSFFTQSSD